MARKAKEPRVRRPRRQRKPRRERAAEGSLYSPDHQKDAQYWDWLNTRKRAADILNGARERPYWASVRDRGGNPPLAGFYPVTTFRKAGRVFYGFLIRSHREAFVRRYRDLQARRVLTGDDNGPLIG